ncbi:unnamed protein product [Rotaria sp. Silwood2]|nr:unnamed protein product [Rotaria sp. Silwood2]
MIDNNSERSITLEFNKNDEINRVQASTLTFKSINYYLNIQKCCNICQLPCLKKTQKQILIDLSGIFQGGMNAIMGPTGSGKSSLLDLLADRKDRQGFQGEILLNGQLQSKDYKYHAGYVVQDDIVSGNLTIKENLMFSANVRLSTKLTSNEKNKIVDEVIVQLGLEKCANTRIGTDFKRGVSGGERKRTNIGMELVLSPMVLFLDEPTTGLDSSMARNVMECLHRLSRKGHDRFSPLTDDQYDNDLDKQNNQIEFYLNKEYMKTDIFSSIQNKISEKNYLSNGNNNEHIRLEEKSRLNHIFYLSQRTLRNSFRDPSLAILQTVISIFLGIIIGLIYLHINRTIDTGARNPSVVNLVAALFCVLTLVFGGFLVEISFVLSFLQWIQYFSIFRYGSNALLINEFIGLTLCLPNNTNICVKDGA